MLAERVTDAVCLDLFAGSGALGVEALSRGASHCDFVERDPKAFTVLKQNITTIGVADATYYREDYRSFLRRTTRVYDLVFLDPPYDSDYIAGALELLTQRALFADGAVIVAEHDDKYPPDFDASAFAIQRQRQYGHTGVTILQYINTHTHGIYTKDI